MNKSPKKTILLSIPNWRSAASILRTDFFSRLRGEEFKIIILSPFSKIGDFVNEIKDNRIFFEKSELKTESSFIRNGALFLNSATNSFLCESFHCFAVRMNRYFHRFFKEKNYTSSFIISIFLALFIFMGVTILSCVWIILTPFFKTNILKVSAVKKLFNNFSPACCLLVNIKYMVSMLMRHKPDVVCVSKLILCPEEYSIVETCRIMKIPTVGVCTHLDAWAYSVSAGLYKLASVDKLLVWSDTLSKEIVKNHNFKYENIMVTGCSEHDTFYNLQHKSGLISRNDFFKKLGLDTDRKLLIFTFPALTQDHDKFVRYLYDFIRYLVYCVSKDKLIFPCQLVIRIHPRTNLKSQLSLKRDFQDKKHIFISSSGKSVEEKFELVNTNVNNDSQGYYAELLTYAEVVIACVSGVILDAAIFDTPIISIPNPAIFFEDHKKIRKALRQNNLAISEMDVYGKYCTLANGVSIAFTKSEFINFINSYLKNRSLGSLGRRALVSKLCGQIDGNASRRIVEVLKSIC